jgi:hypothetical protein
VSTAFPGMPIPPMLPLLSSPLAYFFLPCIPFFFWRLSHGLNWSGGFLWRWDLSSPTTCSPCGLTRPSPDALCVFRRAPEGLGEAPPSIRRLLCMAWKFTGPPPPVPRRGATQHRNTAYASLSTAPSGTTPVLRNRHSAMSNFRATATIPRRLTRLPPPPKRSRNQQLKALSGW